MDIIGRHDIATSSSYLALYQVRFSLFLLVVHHYLLSLSKYSYIYCNSACYIFQSSAMAQTLHSLVERIQTDSSLSRLAAVMRQRNILAKKFLHQETVSSVFASTTQTLGEFEVILLILCKLYIKYLEKNIKTSCVFFSSGLATFSYLKESSGNFKGII